jgi:hypothetical protein
MESQLHINNPLNSTMFRRCTTSQEPQAILQHYEANKVQPEWGEGDKENDHGG